MANRQNRTSMTGAEAAAAAAGRVGFGMTGSGPMPGRGMARFMFLRTDMNGRPLSGSAFSLRNASGQPVYMGHSGLDGMVRFHGLRPGTYTLVETRAPRGYAAYAQTHQLTIAPNGAILLDGKMASNHQPIALRSGAVSPRMPLGAAANPTQAPWQPVRTLPMPAGTGMSTPANPMRSAPMRTPAMNTPTTRMTSTNGMAASSAMVPPNGITAASAMYTPGAMANMNATNAMTANRAMAAANKTTAASAIPTPAAGYPQPQTMGTRVVNRGAATPPRSRFIGNAGSPQQNAVMGSPASAAPQTANMAGMNPSQMAANAAFTPYLDDCGNPIETPQAIQQAMMEQQYRQFAYPQLVKAAARMAPTYHRNPMGTRAGQSVGETAACPIPTHAQAAAAAQSIAAAPMTAHAESNAQTNAAANARTAAMDNATMANAGMSNVSMDNATRANMTMANAGTTNASMANTSMMNAPMANATMQSAAMANPISQNSPMANPTTQSPSANAQTLPTPRVVPPPSTRNQRRIAMETVRSIPIYTR